jgi:hypothetical protein
MANDDTRNFAQLALASRAEGKSIRVGLYFVGTAYTDVIWIFQGIVSFVREHGAEGTVLNCIEYSRKFERELPLREINQTDFPWEVPLESVGQKVPIVYGKMPNCKGIAIWTYPYTTLYASHGTDETTLVVSSVENFPASGTVLVDGEEIQYSGTDDSYAYGDDTACALLNCTRSATPAPHEQGTEVSFKKPHYYIFADHGCALLQRPLINEKKPIDSYTRSNQSTSFARTAGCRTALVLFSNSPARYLEIGEGKQRYALYPDEVHASNGATDPENAINEIETADYATVSSSASPLMVTQTQDVSGNEYDRGPIKQAFIAVEFENTDFDVSDLTIEVS